MSNPKRDRVWIFAFLVACCASACTEPFETADGESDAEPLRKNPKFPPGQGNIDGGGGVAPMDAGRDAMVTADAAMDAMADDPPPSGPAYYVSPTGNDANPGTQAAPWRTIQKVADSLVAGDTAILLDGTYEQAEIEFKHSGTATNRITVRAQNKWGAVISSTSGCHPAFSISASYITVKGLRFSVSPRNPTCTIYTSANVHIRAWESVEPTPANPTTGNVGFVADAIKLDPGGRAEGVKSNQDFTVIQNSELGNSAELFDNKDSAIRNNVFVAQDPSEGISIFVKGGVRNAQIYGNVIHNQAPGGVGIYLGGSSCSTCVFDQANPYEAYNAVAYDNVILNESGGAMVGLAFDGAKDSAFYNNVVIGGRVVMGPSGAPTVNPTLMNNIVVCNGATALSGQYTGTLTVDHNDFFQCSGTPPQANPVVGDPLFVAAASDWHLQPGSPALNSGSPVSMIGFGGTTIDVSRDKNGVARSAPWDLGVYDQ